MSRLCTDDRETIVKRLLTAKELSQKTYDTIAQQVGMTNVMVGQIFHRQAQLKEYAVDKMKRAVPLLSDSDIFEMCKPPFRSYDPLIIQEPTIYRLNEVCMHFGETIKEIINEKLGDGIMSAIDFNCKVDTIKGSKGEDRIVVTMDGKYLPYSGMRTDDTE